MFDLDLTLAVAHHLLFIGIAVLIAGELLLIRHGMMAADIVRVSRLDAWYGMFALAILAVGFARAIYASKGWDYYAANPFFHAKLGAFVIVGVLSIWPTMKIIQWRRRAKTGTGPAESEIAGVRRVLWLEVFFFALMPVFAAAMARGANL